jgi:hypothetical protein
MKKTALIASTAAILALMGTLGAAEAAKSDGKGKGHPNAGAKHSSHNSQNKHAGRRDGQHGRRFARSPGIGIYLSTGASGAGGCSYAYRKWQATGNRYWRNRYNDCRNG